MVAPDEIVARRLLQQADRCERLSSSLCSTVLRQPQKMSGLRVCAVLFLHDHDDDGRKGRRTLWSHVWPDRVERFRQLRLSMRRAVYLPTSHPI
jgi:hypothetical protein